MKQFPKLQSMAPVERLTVALGRSLGASTRKAGVAAAPLIGPARTVPGPCESRLREIAGVVLGFVTEIPNTDAGVAVALNVVTPLGNA